MVSSSNKNLKISLQGQQATTARFIERLALESGEQTSQAGVIPGAADVTEVMNLIAMTHLSEAMPQ